MPTMESRKVKVHCSISNERERTIELDNGARKAWFPKSQVTLEDDGKLIVATMPEWLALDRGFI